MPTYRLTVPHTAPLSGEWLDAGTHVGDGTPYPWKDPRNGKDLPPSLGMIGTDDESQSIIDRHYDEEVRQEAKAAGADMGDATENVAINKPNPNVSPGPAAPGSQTTPARNTAPPVDPLRVSGQGPKPPPASAPQGASAGPVIQPQGILNNGKSTQDSEK